MFIIVVRDYESGRMYKVAEMENKFDAYFRIEELASNYVERKMGTLNSEIYTRSKSKVWGKVPVGFFVAKHEKFPKMLIYEKKDFKGIFYGYSKTNLVITFEICEVTEETAKNEIFDQEIENQISEKKFHWEEIHKQIVMKYRDFDEPKSE